ncbi:LIM domain-containing protein A isoform X1 [Rhopalosiphum padi]|uniref:LIM domain-containing protein A isoform X1 n=2 Tax=Rhopalosiphum padi TaxID=40932 RepID=UPI00298DCD1D|nr:LIM domain-containing protein A isoform X1 [Rhopalosiphum padi]
MIDRRPDLEVIDVSQNGLITDMDTPQYSLRWNNHLVHMMDAIEVLLQNETLVDVTLVCEKTQFKAHKVVLSACSPYFQRLFSETPCKHPVIVLKDLPDWEMRAIIHFMYKGEINVGQEQLPLLLQAAETLQIRGLAHTERIPLFVDSPTSSSTTPTDVQPPPSQQQQQPPLPSSHHHGSSGHHHHHHHHSSRGHSPGGKSGSSAGHELMNGQSSPGKGHHHHHHHHRHRTADSPQSPRNKSQPPPPHHALALPPPPPPHHRDGSAGRMSPTTRMFFQAAAAAAAAAAANPYDPSHIRLPQIQHMPPITFNDRNCPSPTPRRKQARPRRRSGEAIGPQDLSKAPSPSNFSNNVAENLSMKKSPNNENVNNENMPTNLSCNNKRPDRTPSPSTKQMKVEVEESEMIGDLGQSLPVELTANSGNNPNVNNNNNNNNQSSNKKNHHHHHHHHLNHQQQHQRHPDFPYYGPDPMSIPLNPHDPHFENSLFPPFGPLSSLSLQGPPHMFPIDAQFGLFPGLDGCRNPLLNELIEPRFDNPPPSKKKKKMFPVGRPKGQHSAPRGGPPRSWTNAELTEALQHVWNKKMTTSQASRIFGIPYNSLLMYVRGKYGKSLKLEQLKKECFGDINGPLDLLHFGSISNNNNSSNKNNNNNNSSNSNNNNSSGGNNGQSNGTGNNNNGPTLQPCNQPSEPVDLMLGPPGFNPPAFPAPNFFPDFGSTFPMGIDMIHLMHQQQQQMSSLSAADKHQYLGLQDMIGGQPLQSSVVLDYAMKSPAASRSNSEPPTTGGEGDGDGDVDGDGDGDCDDDDGADDCGVDDEEEDDDDDDVVAMDFSKAGDVGGGDVASGDVAGGSVGGGAGAGDEDDGVDDEEEDDDDDERLSPEADDKDKEQD